MAELLRQTDTEILILFTIIAAIPAMIIARFILFMILPKSWLKRWFSN